MKKNLGIGCFHFQPTDYCSYQGENYFNKLKEELEKISSINNINIIDNSTFSKPTLEVEHKNEELPSLENGTGYYPYIENATVEFEVFIPKRIQNSLKPIVFPISTEKFRVRIFYPYTLTFTTIEPVGSKKYTEASSAVVIVREFLKDELAKIEECKFKLECLGPSPMHIDIELNTDNRDILSQCGIKTENFGLKINSSRAYDHLIFYGAKEVFKDINELENFFVEELEDEFSLFYSNSLSRRFQFKKFGKVEQLLLEAKKGFRVQWWKFPLGLIEGRKLDELFIEIFSLSEYRVFVKHQFHKNRDSITREKTFFLKDYINQEDESYFHDQLKEITQVANFMDKKYSNRRNNLNILISTLLGAVIGACLVFFL